jgi:hypothetical protein
MSNKKRLSKEQIENLGESVAYMRDVDGMTWDYIGARINLPPETCRNAYRKCKKEGKHDSVEGNSDSSHTKSTENGETYEETTEDKNNHQVSYTGERITTLEQLLEFSHVDLNVWEVDHYVINKWEGYRAAKSNDLKFTSGVMDGWTKDTGGIVVSPLFQIKVWLIRKNPEPLIPFISVVKVSGHTHPKKQYAPGKMGMWLIIPDVQMGFKRNSLTGKLEPIHDRRAMNIVSQIAGAFPFEGVIWLGDLDDMTDVTDHFIHSPEFDQTLQPTLNETAWWLSEICSACPDAQKYYICGNHEQRLETAIISKVPQIYNVKNRKMIYSYWELRNLLSLDDMGIQWKGPYPNGEVWITDRLRAVHGQETTAVAVVNKADCSTIFGHLHRVEQASRTVWSRGGYRTITAYCPGFLGSMSGIVPGTKDKQNWSQGFAIVQCDQDGETIEHIPIYNGSAIYDRSRWVGVDYGDKY